jgi:hypothetical protein
MSGRAPAACPVISKGDASKDNGPKQQNIKQSRSVFFIFPLARNARNDTLKMIKWNAPYFGLDYPWEVASGQPHL